MCHNMSHRSHHVLPDAGPHEVSQRTQVMEIILALEASETDDHTLHAGGVYGADAVWKGTLKGV